MIGICLLLILIIIILLAFIAYLNAYNSLIISKIKMDNSYKNIKEDLDKKFELMNKLSNQIKKVIKKKNYLKEFFELKKEKLNIYELDIELQKHLLTMITLKDDFKDLNNDDFNNIVNEINLLNQKLTANKKFFNSQNNILMKKIKGYYKFVAKINNIKIKTSFEIKEPKTL